MVAVIAIVAVGLAALAVLALIVGLFDAARAQQWRSVARDRRTAWEQRRHEEHMAPARGRFPRH